jgi:hypothetical protein
MSKSNDTKQKIQTDEDFINYPKFSNSIKKLMSKYPDGVEDEVIAKALMIPVEEVEARFGEYISTARERMGIQDGNED